MRIDEIEVVFRLFIDEVGGSHPIKLAVDLTPDDVIARRHPRPRTAR